MDVNNFDRQAGVAQSTELVNRYMRSVYNWMAAGVGLTAIISVAILSNQTLLGMVLSNPILVIAALIAEFALVFVISGRIAKLSAGTATGLFMLYSALNGVTLTIVLAHYTHISIASTFITVAAMFGGISLYGLVTKRDLTSVGSFATMGLIGLLVAMVVNFFLRSPMLYYLISTVGVIVFVGLTAYDTQRLKEFGASAPADDSVAMRRGVILGALTLYLDFINLFLMMLRLLGNRE